MGFFRQNVYCEPKLEQEGQRPCIHANATHVYTVEICSYGYTN